MNEKECALAHSRAEARLLWQPSTLAPSAHPRGRFFIVRKRGFPCDKIPDPPKGPGYRAVPPQLTCTLHVRSASVNAGPTLPYWGKAPRVGSKCSAQLLPPLQPLRSITPSLLFLFCASFLSVIDDKKFSGFVNRKTKSIGASGG